MTADDRPRRAATSRRAWLILVLLLGLLGMHGLASDHTSMTVAGAPSASSSVGSVSNHAARTAMSPTVSGVTSTSVGRPQDISNAGNASPGMVMTGLCIAVLHEAPLLPAEAGLSHCDCLPPQAPLLNLVLARSRALPASRAPDLVAGLCVSRT